MIPNETMSIPTFPSPPLDPEVAFATAIMAFDGGSVSPGDVRALSDLTRARRAVLRGAWPTWDVSLRRDITRSMNALSTANVDMLFGRAYRVALDDSDAEVRHLAIAGLWEDIGDDVRQRLLDLAATDPSPDVREEAVRGLGRFAEAGAEGSLNAEAIAEVRAVLTTIAGDGARSDELRERAIESLGVFSDSTASRLIEEAYSSDDPAQMTAAVVAMGKSRSTRWLDTVMSALDSDDIELRREAAKACGLISDTVVVVELAKAALDPEHEVRIAALDALAAIGGKGAARILETAATDDTYPDQEAAELAFASIVDDPMLS